MAKDFILPDIGEGIVECEVVEWLVAEGDKVTEDQPICDVMTDKALVQIPAVHDGVITKLYYAKGDIALVLAQLFAMEVAGEARAEPEQKSTPNETVTTSNSTEQLEDFILPDIGEGIVECEIVEWLVSEGDEIEEDQAVCDVMTDKALVQIPAKYTGTVVKLYYAKGDVAQVHSPLFQMSIAGTHSAKVDVSDALVKAQTKAVEPKSVVREQAACATSGTAQQAKQENQNAVASPAVRRKATRTITRLNSSNMSRSSMPSSACKKTINICRIL